MTAHDASLKDATPDVTARELFERRVQVAARLMLRFVLTGCQEKDAELFSMSVARDLTEYERGALVAMLLNTFPPDVAESLCQAWFRGAGFPSATLMDDAMSDARFWAGGANAKELDAYAVACFTRMSQGRKAQFLEWAKGKVEA